MIRSTSLLSGILAIGLSIGLLACGGEPADDTPMPAEEAIADLSGLEEGWNVIAPGGDTICSDGTPYKFFVRPGASDKLVVYFQGGGGCWTGATCDPDLQPTYNVNLAELDTVRPSGIFDFANAENPFASHSVVFAPYCTGDVHIGDRVAEYEAPAADQHDAHALTVHHRGVSNSQAVLDWTYGHFFRPTSIFVTGSSAGSIPSPYYAMHLADHYPESRITQLGDGAGGYRRSPESTSPTSSWGTMQVLASLPYFSSMASEDFNYERLYVAAGQQHPQVAFAAYDAAEDRVQKRFLALSGNEPGSLLDLLQANQDDIRAKISNYHSYIAGGDSHTILMRPEFYTYHVDGVRIRDWVAAHAAGETVEDVRCGECAEAETLPTADGNPGSQPSSGGGS
jgi:hypothetical protein